MGNAELILFAIKAAVRLAEATRRAYVDSTRRRALTLPLPNFGGRIDAVSASAFYRTDGIEFNTDGSRVKDLTDRVFANEELTEEEKSEYIDLYLEDRALLIFREGRTTTLRAVDLAGASPEEWIGLLEIRQWRKGDDPNPSPVQRIAGTLIEIGVDYFQRDPSLLRTERPSGQAIASFLSAIDDVAFSTTKPPQLVAALFGALAETVTANPELFGDDEASRRLVGNVTRALAKDAHARIEAAGDVATEEGIEAWARLVFRSMLRSAGETVLSAPDLYLGVKDGRATLVENVGRAVLDAVIAEDSVDLSNLFTQEAMDGLVKAALRAVAASPDLLGIGHEGVSKLVRSIASELAASSKKLGPDLLPEALRIVLDKTGDHVDLLLPEVGDPARPLLVTASRVVLERLAEPDAAGNWRPQFDKADVLAVLEEVLEEVVQNPRWIAEPAGDASNHLTAILEASLGALASMKEPRLRPKSALLVLRAAVGAGGQRLELVGVDPATGEPIAKLVLDAVFSTLRNEGDRRAAWVLARDEAVTLAAVEALGRLADKGVTLERIEAVKKALESLQSGLAQGKSFDLGQLGEQIDAAISNV